MIDDPMKYLLTVTISILFLLQGPSQAFTQNNQVFFNHIHDYPNPNPAIQFSRFFDQVVLDDGSTIAMGDLKPINGTMAVVIHCIDTYGNAEWTDTISGFNTSFYEFKIEEVEDGNVIVTPDKDRYIKYSRSGQLMWSDSIPKSVLETNGLGSDVHKNILGFPDGRMLLLSDQYSVIDGDQYPRLLMLDSQRTVLMDTVLPFGDTWEGREIQGLSDGSYLLIGETTLGQFNYPTIVKVAPDGGIIWSNHVVNAHNPDNITRAVEHPGGGVSLFGEAWLVGYFQRMGYVCRLDQQGDSLWTRAVAEMELTGAAEDEFGNFYVSYINNFPQYPKITKIDSAANTVWLKDYEMEIGTAYLQSTHVRDSILSLAGSTFANRGLISHLDTSGNLRRNYITGKVFYDSIANCIPDSGEFFWTEHLMLREPDSIFTMTDRIDGQYTFRPDSGDYWVSLAGLIPLWDLTCPINPDSHYASFSGINDSLGNADFALEPNILCPYLKVSMSTPRLRHCREAEYVGRVENRGTMTAQNAYVDIELDPMLTIVNPSPSIQSLGNNTYRIQLGNINIFQGRVFRFTVQVTCDPVIRRTACSKVTAYPADYCEPLHPNWSGASLEVDGECAPGDTVRFTITNTGTANMNAKTGILIAEDDILRWVDSVKLDMGEDTVINIVGNGSTWTCLVDQVPFHPGKSYPRATVEACGQNINGGFSTGHVMTVFTDDLIHFVDVDCQEIFGSCDPNDKVGQPLGTGPNHHINDNDRLEYRIRFQNVGNDTAFKVVIRDQLPPELDITTLQLGASSHNYTFQILANNVLEWTFSPIALPDSATDEPGSNGFVKFEIDQIPGNPPGTVIKNAADIYFDFNGAIITDTSWHTIADSIMPSAFVSIEEMAPGVALDVYPNPFRDRVTFRLQEGVRSGLRLEVYDLMGRPVAEVNSASPTQISLDAPHLANGTYLFRLWGDKDLLGRGKLVVQK